MLNITVLLLLASFITLIVGAMGKCPLWNRLHPALPHRGDDGSAG